MLSRERAAKLLARTAELINGERAKNYGEPEQSFQKIADYWTAYLGVKITVYDVGMLMVLLKMARGGRGERFHEDNLVDICGYASLIGSDDKAYKELKVNE